MGQRLALGVARQQPGDPHGVVVYVHPLLVPRDGGGEQIEELIRRGDEARPQVNPRAVGQLTALDGCAEVGDAEFADGPKQRRLDDE